MKKRTKKEAVKAGHKRKKKLTKSKTKKTRRPDYAALNPRFISRIKQEYLDVDYVNKLSKRQKQWLNDFMAEELNAEVGAQKNAKQNRFNKTKKAVKRVTDGNNQRNRDIYSQSKAQGRLFYLTSEKIAEFKDAENDNQANHHENHLIDILDAKNSNDAELEPLIERKEAIEEILKKDIPTKQSKEELNAELVLIKKELNLL